MNEARAVGDKPAGRLEVLGDDPVFVLVERVVDPGEAPDDAPLLFDVDVRLEGSSQDFFPVPELVMRTLGEWQSRQLSACPEQPLQEVEHGLHSGVGPLVSK